MYRILGMPVLTVAALAALSACQQGTPFGEGSLFGDNRANIAGARRRWSIPPPSNRSR
jgi:hypothetical protein